MTPVISEPSPARQLRSSTGARAALTLLIFINLFNYIDRYVLAAVVDPIRDSFFPKTSGTISPDLARLQQWSRAHLGFTPDLALIGLLSMAFMITYMAGAPIFGKLAERHRRWMLIGVGVIVWSLASGASGLAISFIALLITRCLIGIGEAAYGPVAPTLIADLYPVQVRGQMLARFYMAIPVGSALGYVLGGAIADSSIGTVAGRVLGTALQESWRWAFYAVVPPGLLLGIWSLFMRDPQRGQSDAGASAVDKGTQWRDYRVLMRTPSYVFCTLGMTAMTFAMGAFGFWMPYYLKNKPGHPPHTTEIFGAILCLSGLSATLLGGIVGDRLRRRIPGSYFLVSGAGMLIGSPFVVLTMYSPFPWIWLWIFITCFLLFFNTGPTNTILANVTHPSIRAAAFALNIFVIHALGDVISPVVIGLLSDRFNMEFAFCMVGVTFVLAGLLWLAGMRFLAHDTAMAPTQLEQSGFDASDRK